MIHNSMVKKLSIFVSATMIIMLLFYNSVGHAEVNTKLVHDDPSAYFTGSSLDLVRSIDSENYDKVNKIIMSGTSINSTGKEGITPVLWCLHTNNYIGLKKLLDLGADPNLASENGYSPVYFAAGFRKDSIFLQILLEHGGNPNSRYDNDFNQAALAHSADNHNIDNMKLLLQYGADIEAEDRTGYTPLISAATLNQFNAVAFLIEKGANFRHVTKRGNSLIKLISEKRGDGGTKELQASIEHVVQMLEARGVKFDKAQ